MIKRVIKCIPKAEYNKIYDASIRVYICSAFVLHYFLMI